ncbi:hypothetical protein C3492_27105 [Streptomyces sp. Ru62]|uniref:hypothetical protein n=1 Tax=Streptomyces sp. Ru62 TaxID=2080745 RepID=UPI000CDD5122|nr:hypothetical protein [Streptomyces sp. Ru62]POX60412.1 hypothetical protein C3492_27105 [Streptomyces sp. Ru62]
MSAVDEVRRDARSDRQHRALAITYLRQAATTQEAAAARLGLPYSTYRRHLTEGHKRLCEVLWHWELGGGAGQATVTVPERGPAGRRPPLSRQAAAAHLAAYPDGQWAACRRLR